MFGATIEDRAIEFSEEMKKEFEMSMVGELTFFLDRQTTEGGYICFTREVC